MKLFLLHEMFWYFFFKLYFTVNLDGQFFHDASLCKKWWTKITFESFSFMNWLSMIFQEALLYKTWGKTVTFEFFSSWIDPMCVFKLPFSVKLKNHIWMFFQCKLIQYAFSSDIFVQNLMDKCHILFSLFPWTDSICVLRLFFIVKLAEQNSHWNFVPSWID